MNARLLSFWELVRTSYWFVPGLMSLAAIGLGLTLPWVDGYLATVWSGHATWVYDGSAAGARLILSTVASSMITVAGVVFSITIVALVLASQQFGPRLLRTFMADTGNQLVLGTFVSTFLYSLLVLRAVHGENGETDGFVPQLSVTVGVILAVVSLGVLIYFIHHVAASIQAPNLIAAVGEDLQEALDKLYPDDLGAPTHHLHPSYNELPDFDTESRPVLADRGGYIQRIDGERLVALARQHDLVLRIERHPGHFVVQGAPMILVWPPARATDEVCYQVARMFAIHSQRSLTQDAKFAIDQLVEMAVRALSPGINDPFTAVNAIDRLTEGLVRVAGRPPPSGCRADADGRMRVIAEAESFESMADAVYEPIRRYGQSHAMVLGRLLESIATVAQQACRRREREVLKRHAEQIHEAANANLQLGCERLQVDGLYHTALARLDA